MTVTIGSLTSWVHLIRWMTHNLSLIETWFKSKATYMRSASSGTKCRAWAAIFALRGVLEESSPLFTTSKSSASEIREGCRDGSQVLMSQIHFRQPGYLSFLCLTRKQQDWGAIHHLSFVQQVPAFIQSVIKPNYSKNAVWRTIFTGYNATTLAMAFRSCDVYLQICE